VLVGVLRVTDFGWTKEQAYDEMRRYGWYKALGHKPLVEWFFEEFNPDDYRIEPVSESAKPYAVSFLLYVSAFL
jgi:hypothetical protein